MPELREMKLDLREHLKQKNKKRKLSTASRGLLLQMEFKLCWEWLDFFLFLSVWSMTLSSEMLFKAPVDPNKGSLN